MRTQDEIVARFNRKSKEVMSFEPEVLFEFMDFKHVKPFLKEGVEEKDWETIPPDAVKGTALALAKKYMEEYGWPKCQDHRGISACCTLQKMQAWAWLLGEDELVEKISKMESTNYAQYGAPILKVICEHFGWPITATRQPRGSALLVWLRHGVWVMKHRKLLNGTTAREQMKKAVKDRLGEAIHKAAARVACAEVKKMLPEINKEFKKQLHDRVADLADELLRDVRLDF